MAQSHTPVHCCIGAAVAGQLLHAASTAVCALVNGFALQAGREFLHATLYACCSRCCFYWGPPLQIP
jgi:hypothetical protein